MQLQQDIEQKKHIFEMERLAAEQNVKPAVQRKEDKSYVTAKTPKIPAFDEGKDEMDSYLFRFERYATAQKLKKEDWATSLSALHKCKALDVYALMPVEEALNYDMLKAALLKRYELPEEGFKGRYKKCRPDSGETFQQFTSHMKSYFTRWIDMSGINKTYDGLADLILRDQLAFICNRDLELFLREREPKSLEQASKLADQYKEGILIFSIRHLRSMKSQDLGQGRGQGRDHLHLLFEGIIIKAYNLLEDHVLFVVIKNT